MTRRHLLLALVLALVVSTQIAFTLDVIRSLRGQYPFPPIAIGSAGPDIISIQPRARGSGLRAGDHILTIDGRSIVGYRDYWQVLHQRYPGESITIAVDRAGQRIEAAVKLWPVIPLTPLPALVTFLLLPWFCLALGAWVTAVRPNDNRAWMMLFILLGITQLQRAGVLNPLGWAEIIGLPATFYQGLVAQLWAISMMLFGFYFPMRGRLDRGSPWIKWLAIIPVSFGGLWDAFYDAGNALRIGSVPHNPMPEWLQTTFIFATVSLFFTGLREKYGDPALAPDDRRRLKLLYWGCSAAMLPAFLRFLYAWIFLHRNPSDDAIGVWTNLAEALFPLTMAYVIVVERARDVGMVIRQGVQYAFARRGIRVMQGLITVAVIVLAVNLAQAGVSSPTKLIIIAVCVFLVLRIRRFAETLRLWVDRRFFREAYNAEQILGELSEQVRSILDRDELLHTVVRKISESLHVERVAVLLRDGAFFRPALATGYPLPEGYAIPAEAPALARLTESRDPVRVDGAHRLKDPLDAELLLPLASRKELIGFIGLGPKKSEEPYSPSDSSLLRTVASQTGLALENSRLSEAFAAEVAKREMLNREIEIAREVQQRLFPQNQPEVPTLQYAGHCRPARGVGGDYYDFLALSSGRLGLAIGDVSGKGVPAALLMASLQASVRGQSQAAPGKVADLMTNVNRLVCDASPENRYATFFYGQFDPATRRLTYSNGGHNPPIILRGGEVLRLEAGGPPVGLFRPSRYEQDEIELHPGDTVVLFTDGISEAENPGEEEWGEEALIETVRHCEGLTPNEVISQVIAAADTFAAGAPQHDDMTVVIARVLAG